MKTNLIRRRNDRRGGMVLETAIVLPVLMLCLIFPAMEFGYFFYLKHTFQGAAREGARTAILAGVDNAKVTSVVTDTLKVGGVETGFSVSITKNPTSITDDGTAVADLRTEPAGTPILVKVTAKWSAVGLPWLSPLYGVGDNKDVVGRTIMRKE